MIMLERNAPCPLHVRERVECIVRRGELSGLTVNAVVDALQPTMRKRTRRLVCRMTAYNSTVYETVQSYFRRRDFEPRYRAS